MKPTQRTSIVDVLVIGPGAAGLRAAIAAHLAGSDATVVEKRCSKMPILPWLLEELMPSLGMLILKIAGSKILPIA